MAAIVKEALVLIIMNVRKTEHTTHKPILAFGAIIDVKLSAPIGVTIKNQPAAMLVKTEKIVRLVFAGKINQPVPMDTVIKNYPIWIFITGVSVILLP